MTRAASGAITLVDVVDGQNPVSAFLTNENHTFIAASDGAVAAANITGFSSSVNVFIGGTAGTAVTTEPDEQGEYRMAAFVSSDPTNDNTALTDGGTGWPTPSITGAVFDFPDNSALNASSADRATYAIQVEYYDQGALRRLPNRLELTFTKSITGTGGAALTATPSKQAFFANNSGTLFSSSNHANLTEARIDVTAVGSSISSITIDTVLVAADGTTTTHQVTDANDISTDAGDIAGWADSHGGTVQRTAISSNIYNGSDTTFSLYIDYRNLGANESLTVNIRTDSDSGAGDSVTFVKVREGAAGADAITVVITASNGTVFKEDSSGTRSVTSTTLTADVYDQATGAIIPDSALGSAIYTWERSGSGGSGSGPVEVVNSSSDRRVTDDGQAAFGTGIVYKTIIVGHDDITGSEQFTCRVSNVT